MKKLMLYKGNVMALLVLICLLAGQSCKKDNQMPTGLDAQTVNAKAWYQKKMADANNALKSDKGDSIPVNIKPKWLNMVPVGIDEQSEAYVIPLQTDIPEKIAKKFVPVLVIEKTGDSYRSTVTNSVDIPMEGVGVDKNTAGKAIYQKAFGVDRGPTEEEGMPANNIPNNNASDEYANLNKDTNKIKGRPQDPITPAPTCTDWYWVTTYFDDAGTVIDQTVKFAFKTCLMEGEGGSANGVDFGVDPNCSNCVIQNDKFAAFLEYAASLGVVADTPFHTTLKINGVEYQGNMTELYDQQGKLISSYFTPDSSSSLFQVGNSYSIGNKGADGTSNAGSNIVTNIYFGNPYYSGGSQYTGGGAVTYYSANAQLLINSLSLNTLESVFLNGNTQLANMIKTYLDTNGWTPDNKEFGKWAINYLIANPSSFEDFKRDVFVGPDQSFIDSDADETSASLNLSNVGNAAFISNGYNTFIPNINLPDYGPNHPVSQAVMNYNPWIYYAFVGANNTSLAHFHLTAKGQDSVDGYRKAIGAIGEGLFVSRLTSIPTSPPANLFVAKMLGRTHIDALVVRNIPFVGGTGYEIAINHTDIYGNYQQTRMHHPDGLTAGPIKETTIAYEVKTLNAQANTPESLYMMFKEGVKQVRHRANIPYMSAAVLVFDDKAWDKLRNSSYGTQAIDDIASMSSVTNQDGEQKIYFRIEKGLSQDANRAFFGLKDRIKNL